MRRFILIDPCLTDPGSHPFQYAIDVLTAAEHAGFACEAVGHREFDPQLARWPARFPLANVLQFSGYSKYTAFGELDRLSPDGSPRLRLAAPWAARHADRRRQERIIAFADTIGPIVRGVAAGDVVLLATASELEFAGLSRAIRAAGGPRGAAWHALFHYPLYRGFSADFPRQERRLDRLRHLLGESLARAAPETIHLHVTTPELAAQYTRLGVASIDVLPYPVRGVARAGRGQPLRVAVLGDARPEKGSHLLAALVERVIEDPELRGSLVFAIQANAARPARSRNSADRAVIRSLRRLAELASASVAGAHGDGGVELLPGPLAGWVYESQLARADATILPYEQDRYRYRCSGVFLESLASGVVPIVTGGGSLGRMLDPPIRRHIETLLARSRTVAAGSHGPFRTGTSRPWQTVIEVPANATAVVVSLRWSAADGPALCAAPVTIEVDGIGTDRASALVASDAAGRGAMAVLPCRGITGRGPVRVRVTPAHRAAQVAITELVVRVIDSGEPPPVGAVGIVIPPHADPVESLLQALRELVRHPDHYRRSAQEQAAEIATRFSGESVIQALLTAAGERGHAGTRVRHG